VAATSLPPDALAEAEIAFRRALERGDRQQLEAMLDLLAQIEGANPALAGRAAALQSQVNYALDTLDGTIYLDESNSRRWALADADGHALVAPMDLSVGGERMYIIDSGALFQADVAALAANSVELAMTAILTQAAHIEGYPVKEIAAVEATNTQEAVYVLDKSNDIYRYQPSSGTWHLEQPVADEYSQPDPLFLNVASYLNRLYILDPARNQIWRHPPNQYGAGFLPGTLPWLLGPGEPDVSSGIDLAVDGAVFVLARDGTLARHQTGAPDEIAHFSLAVADGLSHVEGLEEVPTRPVALFAGVEDTPLYVADAGRRRVVALDRRDGRLLRQWAAPDNPDFATLRGVAARDGQVYVLAGASLYRFELTEGMTDTLSLAKALPALNPPPVESGGLSPGQLAPNDPRQPALLATYNFTMPIKGALLPDRDAVYPGSRRSYRYGVHEGLDIYGDDVGVTVEIGTPVNAAAEGTIMRADVDYREMSLDQVNALLADAHARHITPPDALDRLGGRQVWIDHGGGVLTKYLHLSQIAQGITVTQQVQAGQLVGYVGLSGTPDGIAGNTQFPHLHFEIRVGNEHQYYLGQWLTIQATRDVFERIFGVPVRPAYLEFRQEREGETG
jgi:murein DD-endopeptidase MepM/ murein hydrolase activator NlpD